MKRKHFFVVVGLVIALAAYLSLRRPRSLVLTGIVTTDTVLVSPEIQGRLQQLLVKEGDAVHAGQVLAVIQPAEWQADLSFSESSERQAAASLAQADANLKLGKALSEAQIQQAEASYAAAQAQVAAAESDLERTKLAFARAEELHRTGAESTELFDEARIGYANAQARVEAARKQAVAAQAAVEVAKASQNEVLARQAAQEGSSSALDAFKAQREKAKIHLDYTNVRAPIDGVVDVRAALQGEIVSPGQPIVTLVNPDNYWVRIDVEESYIDSVRLGDKLPLRLPSGATLEGTVSFRGVDAGYATQRDVSRTKRDIKTFEVRLRCDNHDRRLALGMTVYVTFPVVQP